MRALLAHAGPAGWSKIITTWWRPRLNFCFTHTIQKQSFLYG